MSLDMEVNHCDKVMKEIDASQIIGIVMTIMRPTKLLLQLCLGASVATVDGMQTLVAAVSGGVFQSSQLRPPGPEL